MGEPQHTRRASGRIPCPDPACRAFNPAEGTFCLLCGCALHTPYDEDEELGTFGDWTLVRRLGAGGMGEVFLGIKAHGAQRLESVLKVPNTQNLGGEQRAALYEFLLDEAEALRHLSHPHIVPFRDVVFRQDRLALVMGYIPGADLDRRIRQRYTIDGEAIDLDEGLGILDGVLAALHYAHTHPRRAVVHGDVKPGNIRLENETGKPWLIDFGLSRRIRDTHEFGNEGTLAYCAPELLLGAPPSPKTDQFAAGLTAYELLTGRQAYPTGALESTDEIRAFQSANPPLPLRSLRPDIPEFIAEAIERGMAPDPDTRHESCDALRTALRGDTVAPIHTDGDALQAGQRFDRWWLRRNLARTPLYDVWLAESTSGGGFSWLFVMGSVYQREVLETVETFFRRARPAPGAGQCGIHRDRAWVEQSVRLDELTLDEAIDAHILQPGSLHALILGALRGTLALHQKGIAHGFICPHTLCVSPEGGEFRLVGLEFSRLLLVCIEHLPEADRATMGHAYPFLAPELRSGGGTPIPASDIYSLGWLIHDLLVRLHIGPPDGELRLEDLHRTGVSEQLIQFIRICHDRTPDMRYSGAHAALLSYAGAIHKDLDEEHLSPTIRSFLTDLHELRAAVTGPLRPDQVIMLSLKHDLTSEQLTEALPQIIEDLGRETWESLVRLHWSRTATAANALDVDPEDAYREIHLYEEKTSVDYSPQPLTEELDACLAVDQQKDDVELGGILFRRIPGGEFDMGARGSFAADGPQHRVHLAPFLMSKIPITADLFRRYMKEADTPLSPALGTRPSGTPMTNVTWHEAVGFCRWFGAQVDRRVHLPTEAQWEYAASGGDGRWFPWGNDPPTMWRCRFGDSRGFAGSAGALPDGASPFGLLDMAGNIWEWCRDWYDDRYYWRSPAVHPVGPAVGTSRSLRGGAYSSRPVQLYCSYRDRDVPDARVPLYGFRIVIETGAATEGG